ncbi:MAG: hypothetical protein K6E27_13210 [Eubacterium sp.]|nr:hypothetical protein [Eubacterium sp.]
MNSKIFSMLICGIICVLLSIYILISNFNYFIYGKTVNLNDYISEQNSMIIELPEKEMVSVTINKCYGSFAKYSSTVRPNYEYYIVKLDDNSTIVIEISSSKKAELSVLDKITEDTLESKEKKSYSSLTYTGNLSEMSNNKVKKYYEESIEVLKDAKVIDDSTNVRYLMIHGGGERFWGWVLIVGAFVIGAFFIFLSVMAIRVG